MPTLKQLEARIDQLQQRIVELESFQSAIASAKAMTEQVQTFIDQPIASSPQRLPQGGNIGQKQISSDPRRTETGMGPILGNNSQFI